MNGGNPPPLHMYSKSPGHLDDMQGMLLFVICEAQRLAKKNWKCFPIQLRQNHPLPFLSVTLAKSWTLQQISRIVHCSFDKGCSREGYLRFRVWFFSNNKQLTEPRPALQLSRKKDRVFLLSATADRDIPIKIKRLTQNLLLKLVWHTCSHWKGLEMGWS